MSGAQGSRAASLLWQVSRSAAGPHSASSSALSGAGAPSTTSGHGVGIIGSWWRRALGGTAAAAGQQQPRAASASAQGMLFATGVLARSAAAAGGAGAAAGAGVGPASVPGGTTRLFAGLLGGCRGGGGGGGASARGPLLPAAALGPRLKSTAAAAAEGAAAATAGTTAASAAFAVPAVRQYGGAALSAGLSRGGRLAVAAWLGLCGAWVYSMVVLGGITRLTRSGLSMTEWKLAGERPPMSEGEWQAEFAKYKASPEYQKVHRGMSLEEFKFIYWMEYAHRMWGRFLGVAFAVPAALFAARGMIPAALGRRLGLLFFMGGTQGLVGWWMVRSGLEEPEHEWAAPRVSPYRLAAHLVSAFAIYATLVWTTLDLLYPVPATAGAPEPLLRSTSAARRLLVPLSALIAVTATSGAFVAGMDAGRAYNTWPLMAGRLVPDEYVDERLGLSPLRNLFENTAAVQFNHRMLATATLVGVGAAWLSLRAPGRLPPRATTCLHALAAVTAAQFALGVWTLLTYVPVPLGSAHQANALNLFTAALALLHAARPPLPPPAGSLAAAAAPLVTPAAVAAVAGIGYVVATQNGTVTASEAYRGPAAAGAGAAASGRK